MDRKKNVDILFKKKYWEIILEQMPPKKRILVDKWLTFHQFVITKKYNPHSVLIPVGIKPNSDRKLKQIILDEHDDGEGKSVAAIRSEATRTYKYALKYCNDNRDLFIKILVDEGIWPKDDKEAYEEYGTKLSEVKYGFVYFIKNEDIYKIGITDNLMRRLNELKPDEVINTVRCSNYETLEKQLHKKFKKQRIPQTEYFRLTQNLIQQVIDEMTKGAIL